MPGAQSVYKDGPTCVDFAGPPFQIGPLCDVAARRDHCGLVFAGDEDRVRLPAVVGRERAQPNARVVARCLVGEHCRRRRGPGLLQLMRRINSFWIPNQSCHHARRSEPT